MTVMTSEDVNALGRNVGDCMAALMKYEERVRCSPWPRDCHAMEVGRKMLDRAK